MARKAGVYTGQAIALKVFPLFLALFAFLLISPWTRNAFAFDPTQAFYTLTLFFIGFSFLMESISAYPESRSAGTGVFVLGFVFLIALAFVAFAFAVGIITDIYNVMDDTTELNTILSILLAVSVLMFMAQARAEIFQGRKLHQSIKSVL